MYYKNQLMRSKPIKDVMKRKNLTLDELLNEEDVQNGYNNSQPDLIKFMTEDRLKKMIEYVIKDSEDLKNQNRTYKFPKVCAYLLSTKNERNEQFFNDPENIKLIIAPLEQPKINITRTWYLQLIYNGLLNNITDLFLNYLKDN